jgi:chitin deacetylase
VWVATRLDIARHWIRTHPPKGGYIPSRTPRALFVERFGDIFEHTPQVAERAHRAGLTPAQDTADGLHAALVREMQQMSRDEKLALIKAHPELAGREAAGGNLTQDSTSEQGRLGFTALTRVELDRVSEINRRYRKKFGFPVIVALARHATRDTVIAEMERRTANDVDTEIGNALEQIGYIARARLGRKFETL